MADGGIDVAVGIIAEEMPCGVAELVARGVEQEGDDAVLGDVIGDVLLRVVGAHLLLVRVFFEHVTENLGVDLIAAGDRPVVEMPVEAVEETEDAIEGFVGDVEVGMLALDAVFLEDAAI